MDIISLLLEALISEGLFGTISGILSVVLLDALRKKSLCFS